MIMARVAGALAIFSFLMLTMIAYDAAEREGMPLDPGELRHNMSRLNDLHTNLSIEYVNLYEVDEITTELVIMNFIHSIYYVLIVQYNTVLPIIVEFAGGSYILMTVWLVALYMLLIMLPGILKALIALYFFIKEKRKYKEKLID